VKENQMFDSIKCVNLDRREDRWNAFKAQIDIGSWPFQAIPERFRAIDGQQVPKPGWFLAPASAWGCYKSHVNIIEEALANGVASLLILEDDALFCPDFAQAVSLFLNSLPQKKGMVYLGGQHLKPPKELVPGIYQAQNVNRTHAYGFLDRDSMIQAYKHLNRLDWRTGTHIDHHLGRLHQEEFRKKKPDLMVYTPGRWLVGQAPGYSNINGRDFEEPRFFPGADNMQKPQDQTQDPTTAPFVLILGVHSSGSSCLAGVLYHLGLYMGEDKNLIGYYGKDPHGASHSCGFEERKLMMILEEFMPFPRVEPMRGLPLITHKLNKWITGINREAHDQSKIGAGKYPLLCAVPSLFETWDNLKIISIDRPLEDSIASLTKREPKKDPAKLKLHQQYLHASKQTLLARATGVLHIDYYKLLEDPAKTIEELTDWLNIVPSKEKLAKAIDWVDPAKQHFGRGRGRFSDSAPLR
jgi:hypothetical protein